MRQIDTNLSVNSAFTVWSGYPLTTTCVVNSSFTYEVVRAVSTPLIVNSAFTASISPSRSLVTTLIEKSTFGGSLIKLDYFNTPIPTLIDPPQPVPAITLPHAFADGGVRAPITFQMYYQGNLLITLNAPEFGDVETLRKIHVQEYSRGHTLISFRIGTWGDQKLFDYSFTYLTANEKSALLFILRSTLGRKINIVDHFGINRLGFVLTPETEVFEAVPRGFSATFKFQQVN